VGAAFGAVDLVIIIAYVLGTTALGVWLGRGQRGARSYFVADRTLPWWAILFSVVATETSALTVISIPGLAYLGDLGFLQVTVGYLLGRTVIAFVLLPRYYQGELVTAYALLEQRFGIVTRRFASITFMGTRAFGDSVRLFATAIPLALILGPLLGNWLAPEHSGKAAILLLGLLTVIYTYYGGMRAVVWTDVVQMSVYVLGGLAALYIIGAQADGGWNGVFAAASAEGKTRAIDFYTGFDRPHTVFAGLLGGAFLSMASHGADQLIVQRLLASSSLRDARRALIGSGFAVILQFALFLVIGLGLWVFYEARQFPAPDQIFPTFIIEEMPVGLTGLVVAAILAAAMSTISSSLNALSAATTHDIYLPLAKRQPSDVRQLRLGRLFTLFWAVVLIGGAMLYREQGTPVVVVALSVASFTYGGLLGGFFLGLLWRRATQRDALLGMGVGILAMSVVVFSRQLSAWLPGAADLLQPLTQVAWPWYVLIGTSITMAVGILSSFTHAAPAATRRES
jgi:solute:Na+ symporter, SSS family